MDGEQNHKFFQNINDSLPNIYWIYDYTGADVMYPINFTRLQQSKGSAVSMALYVAIQDKLMDTRLLKHSDLEVIDRIWQRSFTRMNLDYHRLIKQYMPW